jgi:hypothetical protein
MIVVLILGLAILDLLVRMFVLHFLPIQNIVTSPIFIVDLIGLSFQLPSWSIISLGVFNCVLLYFVSKQYLASKAKYIPSLLYAITPWSVYVDASGSVYVLLLFLILVFILIKLYLATSIKKQIALGVCLLLCMSISLPSFFAGMVFLLMITLRRSEIVRENAITCVIVTTGILLALALILLHIPAFKSIFVKEFLLFGDVGIVNTVNQFQGELREDHLGIIARVIENKYIYITNYVTFNALKNLSPVTYFTSQSKMLGFSFSPPIYIGLLIPFFYGVVSLLRKNTKSVLGYMLVLVLIIPSVVSRPSPDLVRLILIVPVVFYCIGLGFEKLISVKDTKSKYILYGVIFLTLLQFLVVMSDIMVREGTRLHQMQESKSI